MYQFNSTEYEDLFDRNQATKCATVVESVATPLERIGLFMQNKAFFKFEDLHQIMTTKEKPNLQNEFYFEGPIQLCFHPNPEQIQKYHKRIFKKADLNVETVSISLFPECLHGYDGDYEIQTFNYVADLLKEMKNVYDPSKLGRNLQFQWDIRKYPKAIQQQINESKQRYNAYVGVSHMSIKWEQDEIPQFNKQWLYNASLLINDKLINQKEAFETVAKEVIKEFKIAVKKSIVNYSNFVFHLYLQVLLSPKERERLKIQYVFKNFPSSNQLILSQGGYNQKIYLEWHNNVAQNQFDCKVKLSSVYTPIQRALIDWFDQFRHLRPFEMQAFRTISELGYPFDIEQFIKIQKLFAFITEGMLQNIWLRGCMVILKEFKFLIDDSNKYPSQIWLVGGAIPLSKKENFSPMRIKNVFNFKDQIVAWKYYFFNYQNIQQVKVLEQESQRIMDIRSNPAFYFYEKFCRNDEFVNENYVQDAPKEKRNFMSISKRFNDEETDFSMAFANWKQLTKQYRSDLFKNVNALLTLQLRELYQMSLEEISLFFRQIELNPDQPKVGYLNKLKKEFETEQLEKLVAQNQEKVEVQDMKKSNLFQQTFQVAKKSDVSQASKPQELSKLLKLSQKLKSGNSEIKIKEFLQEKQFCPLLELEVVVEKFRLSFEHNDQYIMETLNTIFDDSFSIFSRFLSPSKLVLKKKKESSKEDSPCLFDLINKALHV